MGRAEVASRKAKIELLGEIRKAGGGIDDGKESRYQNSRRGVIIQNSTHYILVS